MDSLSETCGVGHEVEAGVNDQSVMMGPLTGSAVRPGRLPCAPGEGQELCSRNGDRGAGPQDPLSPSSLRNAARTGQAPARHASTSVRVRKPHRPSRSQQWILGPGDPAREPRAFSVAPAGAGGLRGSPRPSLPSSVPPGCPSSSAAFPAAPRLGAHPPSTQRSTPGRGRMR